MVFGIFVVLFPDIEVVAKEEKIAEIGITEFLVFCDIANFDTRQEFVGASSNIMAIFLAKIL
jgi:hypothetical protein